MFTMGIDQFGHHYDDLGKHPRKTLMERLGRKRAQKMYQDCRSGESKHVGYIIGTMWITLYTVTPIKRPA